MVLSSVPTYLGTSFDLLRDLPWVVFLLVVAGVSRMFKALFNNTDVFVVMCVVLFPKRRKAIQETVSALRNEKRKK